MCSFKEGANQARDSDAASRELECMRYEITSFVQPSLIFFERHEFHCPVSISSTAYMPSRIWIVVVPVTVSTAAFIFWQHHTLLTSQVRVETKVKRQLKGSADGDCLPDEVVQNESQYVVVHEHASKPVLTKSLPNYIDLNLLLTTYLRYTMSSFARSPQGYFIWYLIKSDGVRHTLDRDYIQSLDFKKRDLVCGVYKIANRTDKRAKISFDIPESYKGPVINGMLVVGVSKVNEHTVFLSDFYAWRKLDEKPMPMGTSFGQWMHAIFIRRLIGSGFRHLQSLARGDK